MKRSGKFYRRNESEIMESLGLIPTKNSGSGWIEKEDGQNENVICQLKSTDAQSIKINKLDIEKLEYNAGVSKKIPVFAINFLSDNSTYLLVKPEDLSMVSEYIKTGENNACKNSFYDLQLGEETVTRKVKTISSSKSARESFYQEKERKYKREKKDR